MHLIDSFWTSITYVVSFLTLSPVQGPSGDEQVPLLTSSDLLHHENIRGLLFKPSNGRQPWESSMELPRLGVTGRSLVPALHFL